MQATDFESREPRDARTINQSLESAKKQAIFVAGEPGELKEDAQAMVVSLGGRTKEETQRELETFTDAQRAGKKALDAITPASEAVAKVKREMQNAKGESRDALQQKLVDATTKLSEEQAKAMDSYRLALRLADKDTPPSEVNLVRYFLCYLHFLNEQYHEAALIGDLVARRYPDSAGARQCAKISLASYMRILVANQDGSGENESAVSSEFEIARLVGVATHLSDTWPQGPEAVEAATTVVPLLVNEGQFDKAKEMTHRIPETSSKRGEAEFITGQGMWGSAFDA